MIVDVDVATGTVTLDECDALNRFHVRSVGDAASVVRALGDHGRAADKADHVWVRIESLRELASGKVDADWSQRFDAMVAYATSKGWLDPSGTCLMAHIQRD